MPNPYTAESQAISFEAQILPNEVRHEQIRLNNRIVRTARDSSLSTEARFAALIEIWETNREKLDAINCSTLIYNLGKLRVGSADFSKYASQLSDIKNTVGKFIPDLNGFSLVNVAWALSVLKIRDTDIFNRIAEETILKIRELTSRHLTTLATAFVSADMESGALLDAIAKRCLTSERRYEKLRLFTGKDLTYLVKAFANANHYDAQLVDRTCSLVRSKLSELDNANITRFMQALAKFNHCDDPLLEAISAEAQKRIDTFSADQLIKLARSFLKLGVKDPDLLDAFARAAQGKINDFGIAGLGDLATVFNKVRHQVPTLFSVIRQRGIAIKKEVTKDYKNYSASQIAETASGLVKLNIECSLLLSTLAVEIRRRINEFEHGPLCVVTQAYAKLTQPNEPLIRAVAAKVFSQIGEIDFVPLGRIVAAIGAANVESNELFIFGGDRFAARLRDPSSRLPTRTVAQVAWGYGVLNFDHASLRKAIATDVASRPTSYRTQELANIAWSLTVFDKDTALPVLKIAFDRMEQFDWDVDATSCIQVYQAALALEAEIPKGLAKKITAFLKNESKKAPEPNDFEKDIKSNLEKIGLKPKPQEPIAGYFVDLLVQVNGKEWVIECDGISYHRVGRTIGGSARGSDIIRDKALKNSGYEVLRISDSQWRRVKDKERFLSDHLGVDKEHQ